MSGTVAAGDIILCSVAMVPFGSRHVMFTVASAIGFVITMQLAVKFSPMTMGVGSPTKLISD